MMIPAISSLLGHADAHPAPSLHADASPSADQVSAHAAASDASASGSANADASSGAITANDFLTLLVTEIKNQDPTSQTDPMTYITQLVGVNSLQQLLQINQTLSSAVAPGGTLAGGNTTPQAEAVRARSMPAGNAAESGVALPGAQAIAGAASSTRSLPAPLAANAPATGASTNAVAQALTHAIATPVPVAPPTQVPLNPEVMRALEHSIPGARLVGAPSSTQ